MLCDGPLGIRRVGKFFAGMMCLLCIATTTRADPVTLSLIDGSLTIPGELIQFDGSYYTLDSAFGTLTFTANSVRCNGDGCPDLNAYAASLRINLSDELDLKILFPVLRGFAAAHAQTVEFSEIEGEQTAILSKRNGPKVANLRIQSAEDAGDHDIVLSVRPGDIPGKDHTVIGWLPNPEITEDMAEHPSSCPMDGSSSLPIPDLIPVYMITPGTGEHSIVADLKRFILSVPGQRVLSRTGIYTRANAMGDPLTSARFILRGIQNATQDTTLKNVNRVLHRLKGFVRIDLSFQFGADDQNLNAVSQTNLDYIADLLLQGRFKGKDVIFAGFTDGSGPYEANLTLSLKRANYVRDAVRMRMGSEAPPLTQFRARGFGETLPVACNDTPWGHQQNRRVEIWIKANPSP